MSVGISPLIANGLLYIHIEEGWGERGGASQVGVLLFMDASLLLFFTEPSCR